MRALTIIAITTAVETFVAGVEYPRDELEIYTHMPRTGGRAFSDHINMAFEASEVVNGSRYGGWIDREEWAVAQQDARCRYRLAFGHDTPEELRDKGIHCPHHFVTLLRPAREHALSRLQRA